MKLQAAQHIDAGLWYLVFLITDRSMSKLRLSARHSNHYTGQSSGEVWKKHAIKCREATDGDKNSEQGMQNHRN